MDTQLDEIVIRGLLLPTSARLLRLLDEKIKVRKREDWFEIFVAIFIVMSSVEFIMADVVDYTARHGMEVSGIQFLCVVNVCSLQHRLTRLHIGQAR